MMKKFILGILIILLCACSAETTDQKTNSISVNGHVVSVDDNGNADTDITNTDFLDKGFCYGDSVNIEFDNGFKLEDIPFLSGMYVEYGKTMVYGKASKDTVSFIQKYKSFMEESGVNEQSTYTITLNKSQKYFNIEKVGNLTASNNFEDYNDEIVFANFREVTAGDIKSGRLYRSSSVIDNKINRVEYTSKLAIESRIKTILNISDKKEDYDELISNLEGDSKTLIKNTIVINAPITVDYQSEVNNKIIIEGLNALINNEYPYLIHCLEGKDRTGYEFAIIEALCNATYEEIVNDYMLTYENYYGVSKNSDIEKYNYIKESNIDAMLRFITKEEDLNNVNYQKAAKSFLINYGMSIENIEKLISTLCY